jgi:hypothetical protein
MSSAIFPVYQIALSEMIAYAKLYSGAMLCFVDIYVPQTRKK